MAQLRLRALGKKIARDIHSRGRYRRAPVA
jgi:hypothetical protein